MPVKIGRKCGGSVNWFEKLLSCTVNVIGTSCSEQLEKNLDHVGFLTYIKYSPNPLSKIKVWNENKPDFDYWSDSPLQAVCLPLEMWFTYSRNKLKLFYSCFGLLDLNAVHRKCYIIDAFLGLFNLHDIIWRSTKEIYGGASILSFVTTLTRTIVEKHHACMVKLFNRIWFEFHSKNVMKSFEIL